MQVIEKRESSNKKLVFIVEKLGGLLIEDKVNQTRFYLQPSEVRDLRALLLRSEYYRINDLFKEAVDIITTQYAFARFIHYLEVHHKTIFYLVRDRLLQYSAENFGINVYPEDVHIVISHIEENLLFSDFLNWLQDRDLALHELLKEPVVLFCHEKK